MNGIRYNLLIKKISKFSDIKDIIVVKEDNKENISVIKEKNTIKPKVKEQLKQRKEKLKKLYLNEKINSNEEGQDKSENLGILYFINHNVPCMDNFVKNYIWINVSSFYLQNNDMLLSLDTKKININEYISNKNINPNFIKKINSFYLVSINNNDINKIQNSQGKWKQIFDFIPSNIKKEDCYKYLVENESPLNWHVRNTNFKQGKSDINLKDIYTNLL